MYFLYSSVWISLFQHEKIKADRLYAEVHASVTVHFVDEKWKGLIFLADDLRVFCMFIYSEYKKCFLISLDLSLQTWYCSPSYHA